MNDHPPVRRRGAIVGLRADAMDEYCSLHANIWPEVAAANRRAGITNHSIFLLRDKGLLFSYSEYRGEDQEADARILAANPVVQKWWELCRPLQVPVMAPKAGRRWTDMDLIFYQP